MRPLFPSLFALHVLAAPAASQSLAEIRQMLRAEIDAAGLAGAESSLVQVLVQPEVDTATLYVDNDFSGAQISTFRVPFQRELDVGSSYGRLLLEGSLAYVRAEETIDLISGPDGTGSIRKRLISFGGMLGAGWSFDLPYGFRLRPAFGVALSQVRLEGYYDEITAPLRPLIDGLLVNWQNEVVSLLPSVGVLWDGKWGSVDVSFDSRYAYAYSDAFDGDDPVQESSGDSHLVAADLRFNGATGLSFRDQPLRWEGRVATTQLFDHGQALGFDHFFAVGGGFVADTGDLGLGSVRLMGSYLFGDHVEGWALGFGIDF